MIDFAFESRYGVLCLGCCWFCAIFLVYDSIIWSVLLKGWKNLDYSSEGLRNKSIRRMDVPCDDERMPFLFAPAVICGGYNFGVLRSMHLLSQKSQFSLQ